MPQLTLTLNGQSVDLPADAEVALSYRANDLRSIDSREAAFSETFTLPLTARNRRALQQAHALDSYTDLPYKLLPAELSMGGTPLLEGFAVLEQSAEGFDVTLTDALGGLFAMVGNRRLRELNLSAYDHVLTLAATQAAEYQDYTQGYATVLADDGRLTLRDAQNGILYYETRLAVYYHTVLQAILQQALPGWQLSGSLLAEDVYQRAVLPQATAYRQLPPAVVANAQASGTNTAVHTYSGLGPQGQELVALQFPAETDPGGNFFAGTYFTSPPFTIDLTVRVRLRTSVRRVPGSNITAVVGNVLLRDAAHEQEPVPLDKGQPALYQSGLLAYKQFFAHEVNDTFSAPAYTEYTIQLERLAPSTKLCLLLPRFVNVETQLLPGSNVAWQVGPRAYPGSPVGLAGSLPDLTQAEFLRLLFNQFNIISQPDALFKRMRFDLFNDLELNRAKAVDWTAKIDWQQRPRLQYTFGEYAQQNTLAYDAPPTQYEQLGSLDPIPAGSAALPVVNATLPQQAEAYTAPVFLPQLNAALNGPYALLWLPFFEQPTDLKALPERWDPNKTYGDSETPVVYADGLWKGRALVVGTVPGSSRINSDGNWLPVAYELPNDELPTCALISPLAGFLGLSVPVYEDAPATGRYDASRRLDRVGLEFRDLLPAYYPGLTQCLARVQVLTLDVRLTAFDLANLDFTVPVRFTALHANGYGKLQGLAYLNEVSQYKPGLAAATSVTLLVLGLPVPGLAPPVPMPLPGSGSAFITEAADAFLLTEDGYYILLE